MVLELSVCLAEVCACLSHRAPRACVAASLKARDSCEVILCVLFPFHTDVTHQATVILAATRVISYQQPCGRLQQAEIS